MVIRTKRAGITKSVATMAEESNRSTRTVNRASTEKNLQQRQRQQLQLQQYNNCNKKEPSKKKKKEKSRLSEDIAYNDNTFASIPPRTPAKKLVSFDIISVREVPSRYEYTRQEKAAMWFTGKELLAMRYDALVLAKSMDRLPLHCHHKVEGGRGLERVLKHNVKKHTNRRKVLADEIAFLQRHGFHHCSDEDLATLFQAYTSTSSIEARGMGRDDEKRARVCYFQDHEFLKIFFELYGGRNALLCRTRVNNKTTSEDSSNDHDIDSSSTTSSDTTLTNSPPSSAGSIHGIDQHHNNVGTADNVATLPHTTSRGGGGLDLKRKTFREEKKVVIISHRVVSPRSLR